MLKNDLRRFFASFFMTLLITGWFAAFLILDSESARYKNAAGIHSLVIEQTGTVDYMVNLLGREYALSLEQVMEVNQWRKEYECLVTPVTFRLGTKIAGLAQYGWEELNLWYKEYWYQQNVAKEEPPTA